MLSDNMVGPQAHEARDRNVSVSCVIVLCMTRRDWQAADECAQPPTKRSCNRWCEHIKLEWYCQKKHMERWVCGVPPTCRPRLEPVVAQELRSVVRVCLRLAAAGKILVAGCRTSGAARCNVRVCRFAALEVPHMLVEPTMTGCVRGLVHPKMPPDTR